MAYVKILRNRNLFATEKYILDGRELSDPVIYHNCMEGSAARSMDFTQRLHGKENIEGIHIIQSFSIEDSKLLKPEDYAEIGSELIKKKFPGYEFMVVTHTDTELVHNHILLNTVHGETGIKIPNKKKLLYDLRDISDELSVERGLSVIEKQSVLRWNRHSDEAKEIKRRGGFSWVIDLKDKCDFAKKFSTSFDEYSGLLNQFDIEVRVENKNIIYHYPNHRQKRGGTKGLGEAYTKLGLIKQFRENHDHFLKLGLKTKSKQDIDFENHFFHSRDAKNYRTPVELYKDLVIPIDIIEKLQKQNIVDYCKEKRIDLISDEGLFLKSHSHVEIKGNFWKNNLNHTSGGFWEFKCFQESTGFLQALEKYDTTGNIRLLLEQVGDHKRSYQSFYSKKIKLGSLHKQMQISDKLGFSSLLLKTFVNASRVRFYANDRIVLFPENTTNTSLTFYRIAKDWVCRKRMGFDHLFYKNISPSRSKTVLFSDPIHFLQSDTVLRLINSNDLNFNVIVPMQPLPLFLEKNKLDLLDFKDIIIVKSRFNLFWGESNKRVNHNEQAQKISIDLGMGYLSVDDLLRDLLTRSRGH